HLNKMYLFWNAALFGVPGFKGNPFAKHAPLPIQKEHFERWLQLFHQTIDHFFTGEVAEDCKKRSELMAAMFLSRLENMRGGADKVIVLPMVSGKNRTIEGVEDLTLLVNAFYDKIRKDDLLAPVFNTIIKDWEPHLEKMVQFWST